MPVIKQLINLLRLLLESNGIDNVKKLAGYLNELKQRLVGKRPQGIYEVLDHNTTLELADPKGKLAVVRRHQKVRFLQDNVVAFADHMWGDGKILAQYRCSPGIPVDTYKDGSKHTVLISLRETKNRGDVLSFSLYRRILRGFTKHSEWWETEIYHRTRHVKVSILFPATRHCRRATITQRSASNTTILGQQHFEILPDGKQKLTWQIANPRLHDRYIIKWRW